MVNFAYGKGLPERERNVMGNIPVYGSNGIVGRHDEALVKSAGIIIGRKGSIGRVHFSKEPFWAIDTTFFVVDDPKIDLNFVHFMLKNLGLDQMNQDSAVPGLNRNAAHAVNVLFPTLPEQQAIASILGALDDKIDLNRRMNETLESMARAIFKSWFVDFDPVRAKMEGKQPFGMDAETAALFPDRLVESELGLIPEGWEVQSVYQIASITYGAAFKSKDFIEAHEGVPVIRIRDLKTMTPQISTHEEHPKASRVDPGDLLVGMDGEFNAVFWVGDSGWLNQRVCMLRPVEGVSPDFVRYSITPHLEFLERTTIGTTVIHLGKKDIDCFEQVCPNASIHAAFGELTNPLHAKRVLLAAESKTLAELRDLLLPKLLSGEIRVK